VGGQYGFVHISHCPMHKQGFNFEKSPNNNSTMGNKLGLVVGDHDPMSNFIEHRVRNHSNLIEG